MHLLSSVRRRAEDSTQDACGPRGMRPGSSIPATTDHRSLVITQPQGRGAGVGRALGVGSERGVGVGLGVEVGVAVEVGVGVAVGVAVAVAVGVGETVGVGVGVAPPLGNTRTK